MIRAPRLSDTAGVYRVCFATGPDAPEATPELLGHVWAGPYLAYAPEWCRVAVDPAGVAGYVLAVPDTAEFERWAAAEWWPPLRREHPVDRVADADRPVAELLASPPSSPPWLLDEFPAHLHIDLLPRAQGTGLGRDLIEDLVDRLGRAGVPGVHLGVAPQNTRAIGFYTHLGFLELRREPDAVWMGLRTARRPRAR